MATFTTSVVLLRWQLMSAILMFLASSLNIKFRKSDYIGLAVVSSGLLVRHRAARYYPGRRGDYLAQHRKHND